MVGFRSAWSVYKAREPGTVVSLGCVQYFDTMLQLLFLASFLFVFQEVTCQNAPPFVEECKKESNYEGDFKQIGENAPKEAKCFLSCWMTKKEELKSDGTIELSKVKESIEKCQKSSAEQKVQRAKASEECVKEVTPNSDLCETAHKFHMCVKQKMPAA